MKFYDWVLSGKGPEPPDQEIIDDDEALDDYIDSWKQSLKNKNTPNTSDTKSFSLS
uniref:Uncharacterized protein n=1 Tax=viral metagenome TaxID=1070528 RepID=A0A6M3IIV7_9ZZZZ